METHSTPAARTGAPAQWTRAAVAGQSRGLKRHSVDFTLGSTVARLTGAVSPLPDLPSPLPAVGASGRTAGGPRSLSRGFTDARGGGPERVFHQHPLHRGEKNGRDVGATKRGKGTKLVAVADRHGLPVAVHTASAAPHEVTLVPATLAQRLTTAQPPA